jgi:hypothetical protein
MGCSNHASMTSPQNTSQYSFVNRGSFSIVWISNAWAVNFESSGYVEVLELVFLGFFRGKTKRAQLEQVPQLPLHQLQSQWFPRCQVFLNSNQKWFLMLLHDHISYFWIIQTNWIVLDLKITRVVIFHPLLLITKEFSVDWPLPSDSPVPTGPQ